MRVNEGAEAPWRKKVIGGHSSISKRASGERSNQCKIRSSTESKGVYEWRSWRRKAVREEGCGRGSSWRRTYRRPGTPWRKRIIVAHSSTPKPAKTIRNQINANSGKALTVAVRKKKQTNPIFLFSYPPVCNPPFFLL